MPLRMTTSVLVRRGGRMLMFDAGEGIQISLKRGGLGIASLDAVAISHLHADHVLGLPGVMMFRAQCEDPGPLTIIGPPGIEQFVRHTITDLRYHLSYEIDFVEWSEDRGDKAWSWNGHEITWHRLRHSTFCLGYRLNEANRPGKFDLDKAADLGVPSGPLFGQLQAGEEITTPNGRVVRPKDVLGDPRRGRIVTFATDTRPCDGLNQSCEDADIAFVEGMFTDRHKAEAQEKKHMTAAQAAHAAHDSRVKKLVLVHISPRYSTADESILRDEARAVFKNTDVGRELDVYKISLPD